MKEMDSFRALGLSDNALYAIEKKGFEEPTDIQAKTIPLLLKSERDIVAQAQTGTGKTAAFALPLLDMIEPGGKYPKAIILTPTRELAIQVSEEINSLRGKKKFSIIPVYGGQSMELQLRKLKKGVDIVVGTPGRVKDHLGRKTLRLHDVSYFILDEADEMLNMGFIEDVEEILSMADNEDKRILLFSATIPQRIRLLAKKYLHNPETIVIQKNQLTTELAEQIYFEVAPSDRFEALCRIIDMESEFFGLVFCRTKVETSDIANHLIDRGYDAEALHGDISQSQRERILTQFKKQKINILIATDVAARGIDIVNLSHVINYSLPQDPESYVHRIGRTGRAGKKGIAITFITPSEYRKLSSIKQMAKTDIRKGKLPDIDDIIQLKKERVKETITSIINDNKHLDYLEIAEDLLAESFSPAEVLSAFLRYTMKGEFDRSSYSDIREMQHSVERKGTTRLFIALGKMDKITKKSLVDSITKRTGVENHSIKDVTVLDKFSFVTVPFEAAELIIDEFNKESRGSKPLVTQAKKRKKQY